VVAGIGKHVKNMLKSVRSSFYALMILEPLNRHGSFSGYKIKVLIEGMNK